MGYKVYNNKLKINGEDVLVAAVADTKEMEKIFATKEEVAAANTAAWGNITGEMSAQTDLTNALNKKQDTISDIATIRAGAAKGATALQSFTESDPTVPSWAKAASKPTYTASEVGALASTVTHLSGDIATTEKGAANGVATLGSDSKIPAAQLPSYVDDVLEYTAKANFPAEGESGKIYIDKATNITYRWGGSAYVAIGSDLALGQTSSTAYPGDLGAANATAISTHTSNGDIHVTATNKTAWNAKYDKPSGGIPKTDLASAVQTSLGKADSAVQDTNYKHITVTASSVSDGTTTFNKYIHPTTTAVTAAAVKVGKDASGHVVIGDALVKGDVGLGNVGNFKAVSTVASQGLTDTEKSNARTNIGAGTYSKPSGGIPKTDLASAVQTSLGKADSALQSYTETDPVFSASAAAGIKSTDIANWNSKTSNGGTITGIKMNGASKGTSGVVDLGTVITAHQDISGKANTSIVPSVVYCTCDTAAATAAKVVTVASSTRFNLEKGTLICVKFTNSNSASSVTLNVNSTGAKSIYVNNAVYTSNSTNYCGSANRHVYYMYDGTYWVWMNMGALDGNTYTSALCTTAAATAAKTASSSNYYYLANSYIYIVVQNTNTAKSALTMNINSQGAKPIYLNGTATSSSNYNLVRGSYLAYYDGTNIHMRTDGQIPNVTTLYLGDGTTSGTATINADTLGGKNLTALLSVIYPVGALYTTTSSTNPATTLGFGTWVKVASKMPIGENVFGNGKTLGLFDGTNVAGLYNASTDRNGMIELYGTNVGTAKGSNVLGSCSIGVPTKAQLGSNLENSGLIVDSVTVNVWQRTA